MLLRCSASNAEYKDELCPFPPIAVDAAADGGDSGDNPGRLSCRAGGTTAGRCKVVGRRRLFPAAVEFGDSWVPQRDMQADHDWQVLLENIQRPPAMPTISDAATLRAYISTDATEASRSHACNAH